MVLEAPPETPKSGGVGDPITISDESGGGPYSTGTHVTNEGVETPQVKGRTPWPIGLHSVEEAKKRKDEEEQHKRKKEKEQRHLQGQQLQQQEAQVQEQ